MLVEGVVMGISLSGTAGAAGNAEAALTNKVRAK
jgi:hypothetical protein